nr:two-component response regulator ORR21-like [Ipomoea batatas]
MAGFDPSQPGRSRRSSNRTAAMKKKKISWTLQLQLIFLDAIMFLGRDNKGDVVPSKVLDVMMNDERTSNILKGMNVQKLTRQHVASHLQKLRGFLYSKTKRPRMNKLGIWNRDYECIRERHEYIKHSQLLAEPKSGNRSASSKGVPLSTKEQDESIPLMFCQENNLQSTLQGFSSSYCSTTTSINNNINNVVVGEAMLLTMYSAQPAFDDNNFGQHLTNDFMNPTFYNNHQNQGFGETLVAGQPETSQYSILESAGDSNSSLISLMMPAQPRKKQFSVLFWVLPSLDDINKEFQDLDEWMIHFGRELKACIEFQDLGHRLDV